MEPARLGSPDDHRGVRPLERHVLLPARRDARDRPPRLLGEAVRVRGQDRDRPPGRGGRARPDRPVEAWTRSASRSTRARSSRPGSARATTWRRRSSSSTPTRRSRTAATSTSRRWSARSSRPDGTVVRPFQPKLIRKMKVSASVLADHAQGRPQGRHHPAHVQPRRPPDRGGRQDRHRRVRPPRQERRAPLPQLVRRLRPEERLEAGQPDRGRDASRTPSSPSSSSPTTPGRWATRRPRSRSTTSSSTSGSSRTTGSRSSCSAPTSTRAGREHDGRDPRACPGSRLGPGPLMGVLRVERSEPTGLAARAAGVAWRDFDVQLVLYAVLLADPRPGDGLQQHGRAGWRGAAAGHHLRPRPPLGRAWRWPPSRS